MRLFAAGDLHLSASGDKPMDIFGAAWQDHEKKIINSWKDMVTDEDIVLVPGDLSWAMKLDDAFIDLENIMLLPGKKIFIKGNHDYWWNSIGKVRAKFSCFPGVYFLQNDSVSINGISFCGSRGWLLPQSTEYRKSTDEAIYNREVKRLEMSLNSAKKGEPIILLMHFPPVIDADHPTDFTDVAERYNVKHIVYGHLHGQSANSGFEGKKSGIQYTLCSLDHIKFKPIEIICDL